jgi:hypothetical protein
MATKTIVRAKDFPARIIHDTTGTIHAAAMSSFHDDRWNAICGLWLWTQDYSDTRDDVTCKRCLKALVESK